jgi:hypothetical protein
MIGKIIFLALCAFLLWDYSTTFLAQLPRRSKSGSLAMFAAIRSASSHR